MILLLALLLGSAPPIPAPSPEGSRQDRFLFLLRTYPERPPAETFRQVARLIEGGDFTGRARAEFWIGSASLAAGDRAQARAWFGRLARDYPGSVWEERSWLGLGDALAQERDYGGALAWYGRAQSASDGAVREVAGIDAGQARILRHRQRAAWAAGALVALVLAFFVFGAIKARTRVRPLPAEARIVFPVLAVLALLSLRVDPAPRVAIVELCAGGALLALLSGLRLRALHSRAARLLHALLALLALGCIAYVAIYRADLVGMVQQTYSAGPE